MSGFEFEMEQTDETYTSAGGDEGVTITFDDGPVGRWRVPWKAKLRLVWDYGWGVVWDGWWRNEATATVVTG